MTTAAEAQRTILIVDDEDVVRMALQRSLQAQGYLVKTASSAADGLAILDKDRSVEMVITDHLMPGMTGLELLKRVRRLYPEVARVLVTGYADVEMAISAINEGEISRFITKPWDNTDLCAELKLVFERRDIQAKDKKLAQMAQAGEEDVATLEAHHPGIASVHRDGSGAIVITDEEVQELYSSEPASDVDEINRLLLSVS